MPEPKKGEKMKEYIQRAIRTFHKEGYSDKEAQGRAFGFWRTYGNKKG